MDAEVQAFKDKLAEKAAAKAKVMEALGAADWKTVEQYGVNGVEGKCVAEMQAMADAYVKAHPEQFVTVKGTDFESVIKMITLLKQAGMEEAKLALTMYELATFERQQIGVATKPALRIAGGSK